MKRFLLTFLFLFCVVPSWSAPPDTISKARQRATLKEPYVILLALDPADPTKVLPLLINPDGSMSVVFPAAGAGKVDQGLSGADADGWNMILRDPAGNEIGVLANPVVIDVNTLPSIGVVDTNNTTTTPLGSGATFTGAATDLIANGNMHIVVSVVADQDSAVDGLTVQFSQDGTNWPAGEYKHSFTLAADVARPLALGPEARFFRVVLTNGAVAQGSLRLTTILKRNPSHNTFGRIADQIDDDTGVMIGKMILAGENPSGTYINFGATNGGNFKMSIEEIETGIFLPVEGDTAHDAPDTGDPVKIGGQARTTNPSAVADGDRVNAIYDKLGRQIVSKCPRELRVKNNITLTGTGETTLLAAGGAGVFRDIYFLTMSNTSAVNVRVDIRDATSGSVWQSFLLPGDGGGVVLQPAEFIPQATANNNWTAQLSGAVTDVRLSVVGCEDL